MGRDQDDLSMLLERTKALGADALEAGAAATRANRADKDLHAAWEAIQVQIEKRDGRRHAGSDDARDLLRAYEKFTAIAAKRLGLPGDFT